MTAFQLFPAFSLLALAGWLALGAGVILRRSALVDKLAGLWIPVLLSAAYAMLIVLFFAGADGGFGTLADVQALFASPFVALAGWIHYLAFDLFMGARIAKETNSLGLPRWPLIGLLPLTFLFGPAGYLGFEALKSFKSGDSK